MKLIKFTVVIAALMLASVSFQSCRQKQPAQKDGVETVDKNGYEYTAAYVCPMHCKGSGSDEPGKCNICGMDYRKNPDHEMHKEETEEPANGDADLDEVGE